MDTYNKKTRLENPNHIPTSHDVQTDFLPCSSPTHHPPPPFVTREYLFYYLLASKKHILLSAPAAPSVGLFQTHRSILLHPGCACISSASRSSCMHSHRQQCPVWASAPRCLVCVCKDDPRCYGEYARREESSGGMQHGSGAWGDCATA